MEEIMLYIYKKYGLKLSELEVADFVNWFNSIKESFSDEESMDIEARKYLYNKYKGRPIHLNEEDLSNMKYLLALLKEETKKK